MKIMLLPLDATPEDFPDGQFGGPRPVSPGVRTPTAPGNAAVHRAELLAALRNTRRTHRR